MLDKYQNTQNACLQSQVPSNFLHLSRGIEDSPESVEQNRNSELHGILWLRETVIKLECLLTCEKREIIQIIPYLACH